jgi:hypothetical protein
VAPVISAGVITANIIWKAANASGGTAIAVSPVKPGTGWSIPRSPT